MSHMSSTNQMTLVPLRERVERIRAGRFSSDNAAACVIRKFCTIPIMQLYLEDTYGIERRHLAAVLKTSFPRTAQERITLGMIGLKLYQKSTKDGADMMADPLFPIIWTPLTGICYVAEKTRQQPNTRIIWQTPEQELAATFTGMTLGDLRSYAECDQTPFGDRMRSYLARLKMHQGFVPGTSISYMLRHVDKVIQIEYDEFGDSWEEDFPLDKEASTCGQPENPFAQPDASALPVDRYSIGDSLELFMAVAASGPITDYRSKAAAGFQKAAERQGDYADGKQKPVRNAG